MPSRYGLPRPPRATCPGPCQPASGWYSWIPIWSWPGAACRYELVVAVDHDETLRSLASAPPTPRFDRLADRRAGWYLGDLHAHSVHSDGAWEVTDLVAAARTRGLDFATLTDHNTASGLAEMERCAGAGVLEPWAGWSSLRTGGMRCAWAGMRGTTGASRSADRKWQPLQDGSRPPEGSTSLPIPSRWATRTAPAAAGCIPT